MVSSKTHVSQAYVTIGLMILQYNFNFDFIETNVTATSRRNYGLVDFGLPLSKYLLLVALNSTL